MIAIISDIHGNYPALQAVVETIDILQCEKVLCLGDVVGYYSQINECIDLLNDRRIDCLLGNHDYYMISNTCCDSKTVKLCLDFQRSIITPEHLYWLKGNKPAWDMQRISLRHAGWHDAVEERFTQFDFTWVQGMPQNYFFSGHTHKQSLIRSVDGSKVYCNPGAVGQPRDNDPRAAFAVLDDNGEITLHRVAYDVNATVKEMKKHGFGDWIWKGLYTGKQIGVE